MPNREVYHPRGQGPHQVQIVKQHPLSTTLPSVVVIPRMNEDAPEGSVFLKMVCPNARSAATLQPHRPLVVERGWTYTFRCQYRSTADWEITFTPFRHNPREPDEDRASSFAVPQSEDWTRVEEAVAIPEDVSYVRLICKLSGEGELCLDDLALQRKPAVIHI